MTTYHTGNPIGSTAVKDLYDNAENFDTGLNTDDPNWTDRLGVLRKSWSGFEDEADALIEGQEQRFDSFMDESQERFDNFIINSGYQPIGDYAAGLTITEYNQIIRRDGEFYRLSPAQDLPYTTTGDWGTEGSRFVAVGDAALRQELGSDTGAERVGFIHDAPGAVPRNQLERGREEYWMSDFSGPGAEQLASGLATMQRLEVGASVESVTLPVGHGFSVLSRLNMLAARGPLDLLLEAGVHEVNSADPIATVGQNQNIRLVGADPLVTTIAEVVSATGAAGNWSVTYRLGASGAVVGQVLRIDSMPGGKTYSAAGAPRRPYNGELALGFPRMGSMTTSGTTCTVSTGNVSANLAVGDLVHIKGQSRRVIAVGSNTFTVDAAFSLNVAGYQWWYYTVPAAGTISTSGRSATVTGAGTAFSSVANAGDFVIAGGAMAEIVSVDSNVQLTLATPQTFAAGTSYTIVRGSLLHEGSYEITAVAGDQVTVRNRSEFRPPVAGVVPGATATVIRTVLKQTGAGHGFVFERGAVLREMTNIALVGPGNAAGCIGLAMNGTGQLYNQGSSLMVLGANAAVLEWGYGAHMSTGCVLFGWAAHICNNLNAGVEAIDGASFYLRDAVVSHNRDIGILSSGGYGRYSGAVICGNRLQGIRQDVGSALYGDSPFFWGNGSHGVLAVNRSGIQCNDGYIIKSGGNGVNLQNGAGGRFSRMLLAGSGQHALSVNGCHDVEFTQAWLTGSRPGQSGIVCAQATVKFGDGAATGNAAAGIYSLDGGRVYAQGAISTSNGTNGARADDQALIQATDGFLSGNAGADVNRQGGTVTTNANPNGTWQQGATYSQVVAISDDAALALPLGDVVVAVEYVASNATSLTGAVRARSGTSGGSISLAFGGGVTLLQNTVLTGTTGADGDVTMSVSTNGNFYIENRAGSARTLTLNIMGAVNI